MTTSTVMRRRLPVDVVARGEPGMALVVDERNHMGWVRLTPWFATEPWRSVALGPDGHRANVIPAPASNARPGPGPRTPGAGRRVGPEVSDRAHRQAVPGLGQGRNSRW